MKRSTAITWDQLKVGAVVLAALAILTVAVYKLGQAADLFSERYALVTFLPSANGLRVGGTVSIAGQLAGSIKSIEFLPPDGDTSRNLRLVVEVDKHLREQVRADSRVRLRALGLLGDKYLDISPGTPRYQVLDEGDTLAVGSSVDYDAVIQQASGAVGDMVQLTSDLKVITGSIVRGEGALGQLVTDRRLYDELTQTLSRTNALLARLQNPSGTVGRMLEDPALYYNLTGMIASVDSLVVQLSSTRGTAGRLLRDTTLYAQLVGVAGGADSLVKSLNSGRGTAGKLLTDQALYDQLNKAITDLNAILADLRRDPRKYTKGLIKVF